MRYHTLFFFFSQREIEHYLKGLLNFLTFKIDQGYIRLDTALIYFPTKWTLRRKTKLITDKSKISDFILCTFALGWKFKFAIPLQTIWEKGLNNNSKILILASTIPVSEIKTWGGGAQKKCIKASQRGLAVQSTHVMTFSQPPMNL